MRRVRWLRIAEIVGIPFVVAWILEEWIPAWFVHLPLILDLFNAIDGFVSPFLHQAIRDFGNPYSLLTAFGFTLLAGYPVVTYVERGWQYKKNDIFNSFSPTAKYLYLKTFLKSQFDEDYLRSSAAAEFEALYEDRYGKAKYKAPIWIFLATTFVTMFLLSDAAMAWLVCLIDECSGASGTLDADRPLLIIPEAAAAGIGGAYLWIVADLIAKARRLDLGPSDILYAALRLAMSAALAVAIVQYVSPSGLALPIAFFLGAFPLDSVRTILRRIVTVGLKLSDAADSLSTDQVLNLDSVDRPTADKLQDEAGVTTISQLAYTDPVQLCMRTGLDFDFVIDLVSQALAWQYLGDRLDDFRPAGLRGAMEIYDFLDALSNDGSEIVIPPDATAEDKQALEDKKTYEARGNALAVKMLAVLPTLPQEYPSSTAAPSASPASTSPAAGAPIAASPPAKRKMDAATFLNACNEIANDPYTKFLVNFWRDGFSSSEPLVPDYGTLLQTPPASTAS